MGLMKIVVRIWDLSFLSLYMLPSVALFQQSTAFLWSQVRRTVSDISPVTLTSIMRARKGSLWIMGAGSTAKAGMADVRTILPYAKPWGFSLKTLQCKERTREGHQVVLEPWSLSDWKASLSGLVSGLRALVLYSEAADFQAIWSLALGHAEQIKTISQAEFLSPAFMPSIWSLCSYACHRLP